MNPRREGPLHSEEFFYLLKTVIQGEALSQPLIRSVWTETLAITFSTFSIAVTVFLRPPTVATGA